MPENPAAGDPNVILNCPNMLVARDVTDGNISLIIYVPRGRFN
jgi:hypothetical protein